MVRHSWSQAALPHAAGVEVPAEWDSLGVAQCAREPAWPHEAAATYYCATCCLAEVAKHPEVRDPSREAVVFWGLPAYVAHCMSSQHMAHARAWCEAKARIGTRSTAGLAKAAHAASVAAGRRAPAAHARTPVPAPPAAQAPGAGPNPGAAEPAAAHGAAAQAPGASTGRGLNPGSTPVTPCAGSQPAAARASEHAAAPPPAAALAPRNISPAQGARPGPAQGEREDGEVCGAEQSTRVSGASDMSLSPGGSAAAAAGAASATSMGRVPRTAKAPTAEDAVPPPPPHPEDAVPPSPPGSPNTSCNPTRSSPRTRAVAARGRGRTQLSRQSA